jgi:hypothetical protein
MPPQPPTSATRWRIRLVMVLLAAVVLPALATLVYHLPPSEYVFYPPCLFNQLTGMHCPGCGATRSVGALVHGEVLQALAYNPLLVAALPFVAVWLSIVAFQMWTGRHLRLPRPPGWLIAVLIALVAAFGVLRNVGVYPWTLLAPHRL